MTKLDWDIWKEKFGTWARVIKPFFDKGGFDLIYDKLRFETSRGKKIYPDSKDTFRAFKETPYDELRVIFLLADPYPKPKGKIVIADGIAMSCANTGEEQPSLRVFFDAMKDELKLKKMSRTVDLKYLCWQGIMMLNTSLTVERDKVSSHFELWKPFTTYLFEEVFTQNSGLIFVLCGEKSHYYERYILPLQHYIFKLEHPANAARRERNWESEGIFRTINSLLDKNNKFKPIWDQDQIPF